MKKFILTMLLGMIGGGVVFILTFRMISANQHALNLEPEYVPQEGDIIFQTSKSDQSYAVQQATRSKYSHMGVIYKIDSSYFVYEAIQPVKLTGFNEWVKRGENAHYVIKRLKNSEEILTEKNLAKLKAEGRKHEGKNYDLFFEWSDDRIYCSELVWKMYKNALNIELGELQELREFDLSPDLVSQKIQERYGENIPLSEKVISPAAIFESDNLETVVSK